MAEKPGFGQQVKYNGWLMRLRFSTSTEVQAKWELIELSKYRRGLFIGTRTLQNGRIEYMGEEYGNAFFPEEYFKAWLIAPNAHTNPIYVLPENVIYLQELAPDK